MPAWRRLGPHYSYLADAQYMVLATGVERWADELDPGNAAKDLVQLGLLNQPAYVPDAGTPSGVPGVEGNGTSQWMQAARVLGYDSGPITGYRVWVPVDLTPPNATLASQGSSVGGGRARNYHSGTTAAAQMAVTLAYPTAAAVGVGAWLEWVYDGATLQATDAGGTTSVAAAPVTTDLYSVLANVAVGSAGSFSRGRLLWDFGYPRVLTAAERAIARAAAQARIG